MSGGLIHLVSLEPRSPLTRDTATNVGSVYANEAMIIDLDSMVNRISRHADCILPEFLMVDMNAQPIENTVEYIIKNYNLIITMGGAETKIPFQMMDYLEKSTMTNRNKLKIPINFNYFFVNNDGLPVISLNFHEVIVYVEHSTNGSRLNNVKLICKNKYFDGTEREALRINNHQIKSRDITTLQIESTTPENIFNIYGRGLLGGIVLRINNPDTTIENIQCIDFRVNGHTRHEFDMDLIDTYCQRLSENAIYIPMNLDGDLRSDINSNAFNLSRFDDFKIAIRTNLHTGFNITAYTIQPNVYNVMSGMIGKLFTFDLSLREPLRTDRTGAIGRIPASSPISSLGIIPISTQWIVGKIEFPILPDVMCPIMYELIDISKGVCKCNQCNNIFGYDAFKQWIFTNRICPLCRNNNIENKYYSITGEPIEPQEPVIMQIDNIIHGPEPHFPLDLHIIY